MNAGKLIGKICLGALVVALIPYQVKSDKEARTLEVRSLLWGIKKFPGEDKDHFAFAMPPSGLDQDPETEPAEEPKEPEEEPEQPEEAEAAPA